MQRLVDFLLFIEVWRFCIFGELSSKKSSPHSEEMFHKFLKSGRLRFINLPEVQLGSYLTSYALLRS